MAAYVGARIKVKTEEGEFLGSVNDVCLEPNVRRLTLDDVILLPSGKKVHGLRHFFGDELLSIEVFSSETQEDLDVKSTKSEKENLKENGQEDQSYHLLERGESVPSGVTVISDSGDLFEEMIAELMQERLCAVVFFGAGHDRFGTLSLVLIKTPSRTFLIDALKAAPAVFVEGLGTVLESPDVLKVTHDCRWASDMLFHQYSIKLTNVFDTQVADTLILKQKKGFLDQVVSSLPDCLLAHLGEDFQQVYTMNQMEMSIVPDDWQQRPLRKGLLDFTLKNVRHLLQLRRVLLQKLLVEFNVSVSIYLSTERNALHQSKAVTKGKVKHLPPEFNNWHHKLPSLLETEYLQCTDAKHDGKDSALPGDLFQQKTKKERHRSSEKLHHEENGSSEGVSSQLHTTFKEERTRNITNSHQDRHKFDPLEGEDFSQPSSPLRMISTSSPAQSTTARNEDSCIGEADTKSKRQDGTGNKSSFISFGRGKPKASANISSEIPRKTEKSPLSPQGRGISLCDNIRWKKGRGRGFCLDTSPHRSEKFVEKDSYQMRLENRSSMDFPTSEEIQEAKGRDTWYMNTQH